MAVAITDKRPDLAPDCPVGLEALIKQCWATSPKDRPSASDVVHAADLLMKNVRSCTIASALLSSTTLLLISSLREVSTSTTCPAAKLRHRFRRRWGAQPAIVGGAE